MTAVYCYRENCINRSNRKSQLKNKRGEPLYRCKKDILVISDLKGHDNDILKEAIPEASRCLNFADKNEY
jgi:hypothetical protein